MYDRIMKNPRPTLLDRMKRYYSAGPLAGFFLMVVIVIDILLFALCSVWSPTKDIEPAVNFPYTEFAENKGKYGDLKLEELPKKKK